MGLRISAGLASAPSGAGTWFLFIDDVLVATRLIEREARFKKRSLRTSQLSWALDALARGQTVRAESGEERKGSEEGSGLVQGSTDPVVRAAAPSPAAQVTPPCADSSPPAAAAQMSQLQRKRRL